MAENNDLYQGNSIFRNQPSYKTFNKSFVDPNDVLYLYLNDLDREQLRSENVANSDFDYNILLDPRTNKTVTKIMHDHTLFATRSSLIPTFNAPQRSNLSSQEQAACLRVLRAKTAQETIAEEDFIIWRTTKPLRLKEKQLFQKFVYEYAQQRKDEIYAPMKQLTALYKHWYRRYIEHLLQQLPDTTYITQMGLPHVRVCKSLNEHEATIRNPNIVKRLGAIKLLGDAEDSHQFYHMHHRLESYAEKYVEPNEDTFKPLTVEGHSFQLPLDSLLFLLTVGDYPDLPTEMLLDIEQMETQFTSLKFHSPFPSRNSGWHTNAKVIEQAHSVYAAVPGREQWLHMEKEQVIQLTNDTTTEICCWPTEDVVYKLYNYEEYLKKYQNTQKLSRSNATNNVTTVKWELKSEETTQNVFHIYTSLHIPAALNVGASKLLGAHAIKLEYKSQFGSEIYTKYELLKAWLQLTLLKAEYGTSKRISVESFEIRATERLTLPMLELQLYEYYHVSMPKLLGQLHEFFKLLLTTPAGKYLLRFSSKFQDKLLLCVPTATASSRHAVQLHAMLRADPTDLIFMSQPSYLPLSDSLYSQMHEEHDLLPCSFHPITNEDKANRPSTSYPPANENKANQPSPTKKIKQFPKPYKLMNKQQRKRAKRTNRNRQARALAAQQEQTGISISNLK